MQRQSKADLHVHSKYSDRPSEWVLRRIGAPESFVEPRELYQTCRERGMDFVTISDHNTIDGVLEISDLPGTFISSEITTYFPEDGCKIHCVVTGITEAQFEQIDALRANIYELQPYLLENRIIHTIAHPLYSINDRLTVQHIEKLLLLFQRFEVLSGARQLRDEELILAAVDALTPERIDEMASRHELEPAGPEPWRKFYTGGSDDHSGIYAAGAYTMTPRAQTVEEFLGYLRAGRHAVGGRSGSSIRMAHSFYHIAYSYYKTRLLRRGNDKNALVGAMLKKMIEAPAEPDSSLWGRVRGAATRFVRNRRERKLSEVEQMIVREFSNLFAKDSHEDSEAPPAGFDQRTFDISCRISQNLGYMFLRKFIEKVREGKLIDSLQTISSLAPVAFSITPYLAAFATQHKDERLSQAVAAHFDCPRHLRSGNVRKAWFTDTFNDVNGVTRTIQTLGAIGRRNGKKLTVVTSLARPPQLNLDLQNFPPVGSFPLPEYESLVLSFPPFLKIIEYLERNAFDEVIISTPGPMGLTALAAARLLGLRSTGIYHTDLPLLARHLTGDPMLEQTVWRFCQWFYNQMDHVIAPSEYYRSMLAENGVDSRKLTVVERGVDTQLFSPSHRDPSFWRRFGLGDGSKFLYVGRVSRDKNLDMLVDAFRQYRRAGHEGSLIIVGDGPHLQTLRRRAAADDIVFTGCLTGRELSTAYASADLFVFPSTTDTFGNAVLEAQASGLPAIVSDMGGPQGIVEPHHSGLVVDLGVPEALTEAMVRLSTDAALYRQARIGALQNARERTWDAVFERFWHGRCEAERTDDAVGVQCSRRRADPRTPSRAGAGA